MRILLLFIILLLPVSLTGCAWLDLEEEDVIILYNIFGTASTVSVTQTNASGGTDQFETEVPYQHQFSLPGNSDAFLYISAQISNTSGGSLTVEIIVNGETKANAQVSGFASIASADYSL